MLEGIRMYYGLSFNRNQINIHIFMFIFVSLDISKSIPKFLNAFVHNFSWNYFAYKHNQIEDSS